MTGRQYDRVELFIIKWLRWEIMQERIDHRIGKSVYFIQYALKANGYDRTYKSLRSKIRKIDKSEPPNNSDAKIKEYSENIGHRIFLQIRQEYFNIGKEKLNESVPNHLFQIVDNFKL